MSVPAGEAPEEIVLPPHGDAAFGALMDALAPEPSESAPAGEAAGQDGAPAGAPDPAAGAAGALDGAGDGQAGRETGADQRPADAGADGDAGAGAATGADGAAGAADGGAADAAAPAGGGDLPSSWTVSAGHILPKLGELSVKLEENTSRAYQQQAFEEVKTEHKLYFDALEKHPRLLVGQQVPAIGREGMETLRDTNDAKEWQEAVKSLLVAEIRDRAERQLEESAGFLETVHASIDLFKNNADLIPGTKGFNVELANQFAELAQPYELRVDGKLQGYSIPVQPIIDQLRTRLKAAQAAAPAAPVAQAAPAAPAKQVDPPQAGISSKAGNSGDKEDFSTLFGTIGLPTLQI